MVQTCRVISLLPAEKLEQLEKENKIKPRVRLQPVYQVDAAYPKKWQKEGNLEVRQWTPQARFPTPTQFGYTLYSNEDVNVEGHMQLSTGIEIRLPEGMAAMFSQLEGTTGYMVAPVIVTTGERVRIPVFSTNGTKVQVRQPIAKLTLIPTAFAQVVATGQKKEEKPSPFTKDLTPDQEQKVEALLNEFADIFAEDLIQLGQSTIVKHRIETEEGKTAFSKRYRQSWENEDFIAAELERMLKAGIVERLRIDADEDSRVTPFASPVVIVGKKDGSKRFCVDYRKLNAITLTNPYPLPIIDEIFSNIAAEGPQPKYFSALDLASGYWQVPMHEADEHKTTFTCHNNKGLYYYKRMPFGLKNAPASFQCMMELVFQDQIGKHLAVFVDDLNVYSLTFEEHLQHLRIVFEKCRKYGLKLKKKKCHFACERLEFLGHVVGSDGLTVDERKVEAVKEYGELKNKTHVRQFLGMAGYYARFINGYQELAKPLTQLTRKGQAFIWTNAVRKAMQAIKDALTTAPVLAYPNKLTPFTLTTDASDTGLGAVLSQIDTKDEKDYVVAYASKAMSSAERNYNTTHREGLAVHWSVKKYQRYLRGRTFKIVTDHAALTSIITYLEPRGRTGRWAMELMEYNFTIEH